jgi:glycolate oxidase
MPNDLTSSEEFIKIVGKENFTNSELDILCYSSDMAALPSEIFSLYGFKAPDYAVTPASTEHVVAIVQLANKRGIPLTPRGGASTGYGGSVPVNGGLVLDLTQMKKILELDEEKKTVTVQSGITWKELIDFLAKKGFQPGIYPSSAYTATVGGLIGTGGCAGLGAPKYGSIEKQILDLEVVLPSGEVIHTAVDAIPNTDIAPGNHSLFVGAEGIFGIITKATLRIYPMSDGFEILALAFDSFEEGWTTMNEMLDSEIVPHTLHLMGKQFLDNLRMVTTETPKEGAMIIVALEAPTKKEVSKNKDALLKICAKNGGKDLGSEVALEEWEGRFKVELLFKRLGPALIPLEVLVPVEAGLSITNRWRKTAEANKMNLSIFSILGDNRQILLMPMALTDERNKGHFVKTVAIMMNMLKESINLGGQIYSIGVHSFPYAESKLGKDRMKEMLRVKEGVDPKNLLNPYKVVRGAMPPWIFKLSMSLMAGLPSWLDSLVLRIAGVMPLNDFAEEGYDVPLEE